MVFRSEEKLVSAGKRSVFRRHSDARRGRIPSLHIAAAYACFWGANKGWDDRQQRDRVVRVSFFSEDGTRSRRPKLEMLGANQPERKHPKTLFLFSWLLVIIKVLVERTGHFMGTSLFNSGLWSAPSFLFAHMDEAMIFPHLPKKLFKAI